MAYANYRYKGHNFVGEVHSEHLIPLGGLTDVGPETSADLLASAARLTQSRVALSDVTLRAASPRAGKILCVGLNYKNHVDDASTAAFPALFPKYASTLIGPGDDIILPPNPPRSTSRANLPSSSAGQAGASPSRTPWTTSLAIAYPTTSPTPLGPYIVTPTEVDISKAGIGTTLNGEVVRKSDLSHLIFGIPTLIATITEFTTLEPGDVILTGTPSGVGYRRDPQLFLKNGDTITVTVGGVGSITNTVRAETA